MKKGLILITFLLFAVQLFSQVKLPRLISNGMVLQRDSAVKIWGWSSKNEKVKVFFLDKVYSTRANNNGVWSVTINGLKPGGPFNMTIKGKNTIEISNILVGDVWICSGQSNMELPMRRVQWIYENEIVGSENSNIRNFSVPHRYNFVEPQSDLTGGSWAYANKNNVLDFSAVSYFFAREIYRKNGIPIGIINASMGGSPVEAWMSENTLINFQRQYNEALMFRDNNLIKEIENSDNIRIQSWYRLLRQKDEGYRNKTNNWFDPNIDCNDWAKMNIPGYWSDSEPEIKNGVVWFRKKINIADDIAGKNGLLILGRIVDADSVYVNGSFVGTVSYQYPPRRYEIPAGLLKKGENTIVVRVINSSGKGGFVPDKEYELVIGDSKIDLKGEWHYKQGAGMEPLAGQTFIRWKPLGLYNGMISPLINYGIKGVIWYQGESNAGRPMEYRELFPAMIADWRERFNQGDFPFLFVQLANYMEVKDKPSESNWALLRESQSKTLNVKNTGMAVTIDIGEWNDIHPLNKKDVGERLAFAAQKIAYNNKNIVYSGPVYESMVVNGNKIELTFSEVGSGLIFKGDNEQGAFAICGSDKKFVWAKALITGKDKIIVWCDNIENPVAVRYAWADNPAGVNLYNKEDLPASPFRTDNWDQNKD